jgi:hypothetical protein
MRVNSIFLKLNIFLLSSFLSAVGYLVAKNGSKDYKGYIKIFSCIPDNSCDTTYNLEPTAVFIANIIQPIFGASVVIFLYIFLSFFLKIYAFSKMRNFFFVIIVYILAFSLLLDITQIRAGVALGFAILAIQSYVNNCRVNAFIYFCVGVFFHYSLFLIAVLLISKSLLFIILAIIIFIGNNFLSIINELISYQFLNKEIFRLNNLAAYINITESPTILNTKNSLALMTSIPILLKWIDPKFKILLVKVLICTWWSIVSMYCISSNLFSRISDMFLVILVVFVLGYLKNHFKFKLSVALLSIASFFASIKLIS